MSQVMLMRGIGKRVMNRHRQEMIDALLWLKDNGCISVKSEFEAEGIRDEELIWLSQLVRKVGLPMTLKIGGCEAVRDIDVISTFDIEKIVAPMIESAYALEKYSQSLRKVFPEKTTTNLFNIETITAYNNIDSIIAYAKNDDYIDGIVFGRVDFAGSINASRDEINTSRAITDRVKHVSELCKASGLQFLAGGSVNKQAKTALCEFNLDAFETRKIVFDASVLQKENYEEIISVAVQFELAWLQFKAARYGALSREDADRIVMLGGRNG